MDLGEDALQLDRAREVVSREVGELAPHQALLESQEELAGRVLSQLLHIRRDEQLGAGGHEIGVGLPGAGKVRAQPPVERVVEVAVVERAQVALGELRGRGAGRARSD